MLDCPFCNLNPFQVTTNYVMSFCALVVRQCSGQRFQKSAFRLWEETGFANVSNSSFCSHRYPENWKYSSKFRFQLT